MQNLSDVFSIILSKKISNPNVYNSSDTMMKFLTNPIAQSQPDSAELFTPPY